jgi:integrase
VIRGTLRAFARDTRWNLAAFKELRWERYVPARRQDPFTREERDEILDWHREHRRRVEYVLYEVAFDTGMRPSELLGLDVSTSPARRVRSRSGRRATGVRAVRRRHAPRSGRYPFRSRRRARRQSGRHSAAGEALFPLRYGALERPWRRALAALGIRYRSGYQTKHTYATLKLMDGESPAIVARNLGISLATLEKHYAATPQRGRLIDAEKARTSIGNPTENSTMTLCGPKTPAKI